MAKINVTGTDITVVSINKNAAGNNLAGSGKQKMAEVNRIEKNATFAKNYINNDE
jgi:hypothetical protein